MKTRRLILVVVLVVATVALLTAPVTAENGVIPFRGHLTALSFNDPAEWTYTPLPGGRLLVTGVVLNSCSQADEVDPAHDYFTGCKRCECSELIEPSGAIRTWGTCTTLYLVNEPGGGWVSEFQGEWAAAYTADGLPKAISLHEKGVGTGTLEGWTLQMRELGKDYWGGGDFGHFAPPK